MGVGMVRRKDGGREGEGEGWGYRDGEKEGWG